jgi:hypothetical protein
MVVGCCALAVGEPAKEDKAKVDAAKARLAVLDRALQAY